jgi:predicted helicase
MTLSDYISTINQRYKQGNATEHTFRGDLQHLLESLVPEIRATNEPKRQSCGAPDYIITKGEIPVGFIEAKDIGDKDLEGKKKTGNQEQFDRYKTGLSNLIFTDYIDFLFYRDGVFTTKISIGKLENGSIQPITDNFNQFTQLFKNFTETISQSIKSPTRLAEMMAGKARLMADIIEKSLNEDDETGNLSNLKRQMLSFQRMLISDITNKSYSDLYAQTIAYGLFAARYHDTTLTTFSREEAVKLIPKSNPFLRKLFKDIADDELDHRLVWIVDELVSVFLASDVASIMKDFGKSTKQEDPVVHFYETFLGAYNPALRKARGVWYTPQPVVNFIVRAVDDILKTEFGLADGLADKSKKKIKVNYQGKLIDKEVHQVQVLDPATGTGTFLAETIKHIHKKYEGMQGIWSKYVEDDLIPRMNGFELLMASYAMAHLKLDMLLTDTGYVPTKDQRLRVFLTNSLEEPNPDSGTLWGNLLSDEADQANEVKRDTPVMCVIGNPPYSVSSTNKSPWIQNLIGDYKKDLNEKKINLDDDYIKFIRHGQYYIDKNGNGILAFISNNSFIDGITHRQMRKHLLESFDKIYILDLHGSAKKKEVCPDGSADQNVFDIMQGVSINIFIKTGKKNKNVLGDLFHSEIYGNREFKYNSLNNSNLNKVKWSKLNSKEPDLFFVPKVFENSKVYNQGFKVIDLFGVYGSGFKTERDAITIHFDKISLVNTVNDFQTLDENQIRNKYNLFKDARDWGVLRAKNDLIKNNDEKLIKKVVYRPFDERYTYYTGTSKGFIGTPGNKVNSLLMKENLAILFKRQCKQVFSYVFLINKPCESCTFESAYANNISFPLYLYPNNNAQQTIDQSSSRTPNLNLEIVKEIGDKIGLSFTNEKDTTKDTFASIDILDYIYAVLHSPTYREKYKEFLKIDFPRVPYPKDQDTFWKLVKLGGEIRQIHLLESPVVEKFISKYPVTGTNVVGKIKFELSPLSISPQVEKISSLEGGLKEGDQVGKVFINETQYFEDVPEVAWNFYIGGYQPAQKWLKDRKDRELQVDDIRHYLKIIVALTETNRLMKEVDKIEIE